jgi:hypothetical protein
MCMWEYTESFRVDDETSETFTCLRSSDQFCSLASSFDLIASELLNCAFQCAVVAEGGGPGQGRTRGCGR